MARFLRGQGRVILLRAPEAVGVPTTKTTGNIFVVFTHPPPPKTHITFSRTALEPPPPPPFVRPKIITVFNNGIREHQRGKITFQRNAQEQPDFDDRGPTFNVQQSRPDLIRRFVRTLFLRNRVEAPAAPAEPAARRPIVVFAEPRPIQTRVVFLRNRRAFFTDITITFPTVEAVLVFVLPPTISGGGAGGGGRELVSTIHFVTDAFVVERGA